MRLEDETPSLARCGPALIEKQVVKEGIEVRHILRDGTVIDNAQLEQRLLEEHGFTAQRELFGGAETEAAQLEEAYRRRGREIACSAAGAEE